MYKYQNKINKDFLSFEFYRLAGLFIPDGLPFLPTINFKLVESHPENYAAQCFLEDSVINFYLNYHEAYPEDYKVTLLHELGHFIYGPNHDRFREYYNYLRVRQRGIEESVVPDTYNKFLFSNSMSASLYTFKCSGCLKSVEETSFERAYCSGCDKQMLLVSGL